MVQTARERLIAALRAGLGDAAFASLTNRDLPIPDSPEINTIRPASVPSHDYNPAGAGSKPSCAIKLIAS